MSWQERALWLHKGGPCNSVQSMIMHGASGPNFADPNGSMQWTYTFMLPFSHPFPSSHKTLATPPWEMIAMKSRINFPGGLHIKTHGGPEGRKLSIKSNTRSPSPPVSDLPLTPKPIDPQLCKRVLSGWELGRAHGIPLNIKFSSARSALRFLSEEWRAIYNPLFAHCCNEALRQR